MAIAFLVALALLAPLYAELTVQYGTSSQDTVNDGTIDSANNILVVGFTFGAFPGFTNAGTNDAILSKFNSSGNLMFNTQYGTSAGDSFDGVAIDSNDNIIVIGTNNGQFTGVPVAGAMDGYIRKIDSSGGILFTKQFWN